VLAWRPVGAEAYIDMNLVAVYCWIAVWIAGLANRDAMNASHVRAKEMLVCNRSARHYHLAIELVFK
jgi:hypothetical protein